MARSKAKYLILSIIGLLIFLPLALVAMYFISTLDRDDLFTATEKFQIAKWDKWCDHEISQFTSVVEIAGFLEDNDFHQRIRPVNPGSKRKYYEIFMYEGFGGYGGGERILQRYENEPHVYIKITDKNVRNWHMGSLLDKTLVATIGFKDGKIIQCKSAVNRHGR